MSQAISAFFRAARHSTKASYSSKTRLWPTQLPLLRPGAHCSRKLSSLIIPRDSRSQKLWFRNPTSIGAVRPCSHRMKMYLGDQDMESSVDVTKGREVLPTNVKPIHYDLTLEPNFEKFTYEGTVIIEYVPCRGEPPLRGSCWRELEADHRWNVAWK